MVEPPSLDRTEMLKLLGRDRLIHYNHIHYEVVESTSNTKHRIRAIPILRRMSPIEDNITNSYALELKNSLPRSF
jgi:hypothetical protein